MDKQELGRYGEIVASRYLRYHGYIIVSAHYYCRLGEIDLVAEDKNHICFVEVKTRSENMKYAPADAVDFAKRNKIIAASQMFMKNYVTEKQPRFDIVEVFFQNDELIKLNHIEGAFDSKGQ